MIAGGLASLALPWILGALLVRTAWGARNVSPSIVVGYGYLIGALATTWMMRLFSEAGMRWHWATLAGCVVALAALLAWYARRLPPLARTREMLSPGARAIFVIALALVVVRLLGIALEVVWRPMLPFDAWTQWGDKARIWYEHGAIVPYVTAQQWLLGTIPNAFTDPHPNYPPAIPLLQIWTTLWLGAWNESVMNLPWIALGVSLALAFYGRSREIGLGAAGAMLCTYLLLSLPFLDIHLALAGIADVYVATTYFLAFAAFWAWCRTRDPREAIVALVFAAAAAMVKLEGLFWAMTLVLPILVALRPRLGLAVLAVVAVTIASFLTLGSGELRLYGYVLRTRFHDVSTPVLQHMFVMDNWHLFWYAVVAIPIARWRLLLAPRTAPLTAAMIGAAGFVGIVYFFTSAAGGVADESLVNRLLLHAVPALAFYLLVLLREGASSETLASAPAPRVSQHQPNTSEL